MPRRLGEHCTEDLTSLASENPLIWLLDGDLADSYGADLFARAYPDRFVSCGIAEQCMLSTAAGLAACGLRPWVFSFAAFLCYRAYDQIRTGISQTGLPVTLVGSHAGACGGKNGKTHLALNDVALMTTLPSFEVWAPADESDLALAMTHIVHNARPAYIRLPRDPVDALTGPPQEVRWLGEPSTVAIAAHGLSTHWATEVQTSLRESGIEIGILHFAKLWPMDDQRVQQLLTGVKTILVLEDHYSVGGLATLLMSIRVTPTITCATWPSTWAGQSASTTDLRREFGLSTESLHHRLASFIGFRYAS